MDKFLNFIQDGAFSECQDEFERLLMCFPPIQDDILRKTNTVFKHEIAIEISLDK